MAALRVRELHLLEQAPRLGRIVVRDRRFEPLAPGRRLAQLSAQPAEETDGGLIHRGGGYSGNNGCVKEILPEIETWRRQGEQIAVATVVATRRSAPRPVGSSFAVAGSGKLCGSVSGGCVENDVYEAAREVLETGEPKLLSYGITDDEAWSVGLPCGGEIDVFVEKLE
jgi:XdhC/CoxI family protein